MNRRQLLRLLSLSPVAALGLSGCFSKEPLALGIHPWPGYEPLLLARDFGWLGDLVSLHEGKSASDSIAGLKSGNLSAACLTLDEVLGLRAAGLPLTVILIFNESVGADVVLARPEIRTPADLKGRRLAVEQGAVGGIVLHKLLAAGNLTVNDIEVVDLPVDQHLAVWRDGKIDAAISYPPFASLLERAGAQRLFDSRQFPQTIFDVLAVRSDRLGRHASALRQLVGGHLRGLEHLRISREDALRRIGSRRQLSFEEVEASYRGLHLPDLTANRRMLAPDGSLVMAARTLLSLINPGQAPATATALTDLVSADYLTNPG